MSREPFISIVIPVRNEEGFMEQCIQSLEKLDYPADRREIIFADGRSTDRTRELAEARGCRVVDNPGRKISAGRNEGFAASHGEIIVFTDADCLFPPDWLRNAVHHFQSTDAGGVSGPTPVPHDQDAFGRAVAMVFELAGIAGGTVHFSRVRSPRFVDDLPGCNAFYRREALEKVMPTNTRLFSNEDVEMNAELRRHGVKLLMTPDVVLYHYKRSSPRRFWKQMYVFAIGRLQLGKRDAAFLGAGHWLIGAGLPALAAALLVTGVMDPHILLGAACTAAFAAAALFMVGTFLHSPSVGVRLILAAAIFATAWPAGFMRELLSPVSMDYTPEEKPV